MKTLSILTIALLMGTSVPAYTAVSNEKSAAFVRDAEEYLKKGDVKAAIIQLKNALVADPKNPDHRLALANLYLRTRNVLSAEKEFLRALELGMENEKVIINLSKTRLLQRQYQMVLDTLHEEDVKEELRGEVYLIIGNAHQGLNNLDKALEFFERGEEAGGKNDRLSIAMAQIYYFLKDMKKANEKVDETLALNPKSVKGLLLKGELVNLKFGPEKSLAFFEEALIYEPKDISALFKVSAVLFDLNRSDEALEKLDVIFSVAPKHPLANYLSAVIYARKNDLDKAEEFLDASGQTLDNFPGALVLRGVMNYSRQNYAQAVYYLTKLINVTPENIIGRRLLGASLLRQNETEQAIKVLLPLVEEGKAGSVVYALLGSANMKLGNYVQGTDYFEKAVETKPGESKLKTQLALSRLASGDSTTAQANLQEILDQDPNSKQAAVFLTLILLREKKYEKAIESADALISQGSDNPIGYNLKGAAFSGMNKPQEAREQYLKALEVSPTYHSASMNLAQLERQKNNEAGALEIYQEILKAERNHTGALLAMARYNRSKNDFASAEGFYQRAIEAAPNNIRTRIEYSEFFVSQKKYDRAKAITQQMILDFPDQPEGYEASGSIDLMKNDAASAVGNFERMAAIYGNNARAYQLLGRAQLRSKDPSAARKSFLKGLPMAKNKDSLIIELVGLEFTQENYDEAQGYIDQLKKVDNRKAMAFVLEGRLLTVQKKYIESLESYLKAAEFGAEGSRFTVDISRAFINSGQTAKALTLLRSWLEKNKNDLQVRHILAGYYLQEKEYMESISQYEIILGLDSKNPVALNNSAWLFSQTGQNKKALATAEQAYNLFPNEAPYMDTFGWILVQQGENSKGLELLQKAVLTAPKMAEIRYHLAVALYNAGRKAVARQELEKAISSGDNFSGIEDARKLMDELSQ